MRGFRPFPIEVPDLRFWGADPHPSSFILGCKPPQWHLQIMAWWSQQDHIICKKTEIILKPLNWTPSRLLVMTNWCKKVFKSTKCLLFPLNLLYFKSGYRTTKSVQLPLGPKEFWYHQHSLSIWCSNKAFAVANPRLVQKSNNYPPLRFRSGKAFAVITHVSTNVQNRLFRAHWSQCSGRRKGRIHKTSIKKLPSTPSSNRITFIMS